MRIGRGMGSGKGGHTATRGMKGQKSRSGYSAPRQGFEGGQMPLSRRLPRLRGQSGKSRGRGYVKSKQTQKALQLSKVVNKIEGDVITFDTIKEAGFIDKKSKKTMAKIVFDQDIDKKVTVKSVPISRTAKEAIEKAGGKVE